MCSDQPDSNTMSDVLVLQCEPAATPGNTDTDIEKLLTYRPAPPCMASHVPEHDIHIYIYLYIYYIKNICIYFYFCVSFQMI